MERRWHSSVERPDAAPSAGVVAGCTDLRIDYVFGKTLLFPSEERCRPAVPAFGARNATQRRWSRAWPPSSIATSPRMPPRSVVLIGYSGGGVLAVLIAPQVPGSAVVTIAANLDVEAWARWHQYTPLSGSLNPATQPPLDALHEWHLVGDRDHRGAAAPQSTLSRSRSVPIMCGITQLRSCLLLGAAMAKHIRAHPSSHR